MSTSIPPPEAVAGRIDRILAFMSLGIALLSIGCFFAIMIGTAMGMAQQDYNAGLWPVVAVLPMFGLPLAFILIIALLILTWMRRGRANGAGG